MISIYICIQVKRLVQKRKAPKQRVDLVKTKKKISRAAAAKSLLELHATLCKIDQELLAIENLLSLENDRYKDRSHLLQKALQNQQQT